jgi:pyruvate dehydrogenase E2 component (dihydrolipoamide acetyltransferase)
VEVEIKMPDLATADSEVTIVRWLVEAGQAVKRGQPLLEIETDKATMDVEAIASGTLYSIHAQAGETVAVGQLIAVIEDGSMADLKENVVELVEPSPTVHPSLPVQVAPTFAPQTERMSLFARNKAARSSEQAIPLTAVQRDVARRLQESKQTIPHYYLNTSANAERIVTLHDEAASGTPPMRLVWDAFFVQAVARALKVFDRMQYRFDGDRLTRHAGDAIGVAADVDDLLYVVPVENPLGLTVAQVSEQIMSRVKGIKRGDASAKKLGKTTITISNLGAQGIESFQAIINPPEAAILAIGKIAPTVYAVSDTQMAIQKRVSLSLSVDHRVVNGKYAARFLSRIVQEIETFQP